MSRYDGMNLSLVETPLGQVYIGPVAVGIQIWTGEMNVPEYRPLTVRGIPYYAHVTFIFKDDVLTSVDDHVSRREIGKTVSASAYKAIIAACTEVAKKYYASHRVEVAEARVNMDRAYVEKAKANVAYAHDALAKAQDALRASEQNLEKSVKALEQLRKVRASA